MLAQKSQQKLTARDAPENSNLGVRDFHSKAPEDWRSPKRFARVAGHRNFAPASWSAAVSAAFRPRRVLFATTLELPPRQNGDGRFARLHFQPVLYWEVNN